MKFLSVAVATFLALAPANAQLPPAFASGLSSINSEISALLPSSIATLASADQVCYFLTNSAAKSSYQSALKSITSANSNFFTNLAKFTSTATGVSVPKATGVGAMNQTVVCNSGATTATILITSAKSSSTSHAGAGIQTAGLGLAGVAAAGVAGLAVFL